MNPFELMELKKATFTPKEMIIYESISAYADMIIRSSVDKLAAKIGVSQPNLTRFCKKLGYNGFNDFKMAVYTYRKVELNDEQDTLFAKYARLISQMDDYLDQQAFSALVDTIQQARSIILTGSHKSFFPAKLLHYNLQKLGYLTIVERSGECHEIPHYATKDDLLIIFNASGKRIASLITQIHEENQTPVALITGINNPKLQAKLKYYFELPSIFNTPNYYHENCAMVMVFMDYITSSLSRRIEN